MDARNIYVTDEKGAVHALDRANGATVWKQDKLFMRQVSRPVALANHVAVGDYQGVVHLLRRDNGSFAARYNTDSSGIAAERGMTLVPPYDHADIIAGQGTAAKELFEEAGELD